MVEWPSSETERTFDQSAANGRKEPELPIFCCAAKVRFRETDRWPSEIRLGPAIDHAFSMLRCGPSKQTFMHLAALCRLKRRSAEKSELSPRPIQCPLLSLFVCIRLPGLSSVYLSDQEGQIATLFLESQCALNPT